MADLFDFGDPDLERRLYDSMVANQRRFDSLTNQLNPIAPQLVQGIADISNAAPNLDPGIVTAAALAQIPGTSEILKQLALKKERKSSGAWSAFKGALRGTFTLFEGAFNELVGRPFRTAVGFGQGMGLREAYDAAGESTLVKAVREQFFRPGGTTNIGAGFFPQSTGAGEIDRLLEAGVSRDKAIELVTQQFGAPLSVIARHEQETGITMNGQPVSPGRWFTNVIGLEPGTKPYWLLSGVLDGTTQVVADPSNAVLFGLGKARKASKVLTLGNVDEAEVAATTVPKIFGIGTRRTGARFAPYKKGANEWLADPNGGGRWARIISKTDSPSEIRRLVQTKRAPTLKPKLFDDLAKETDEAAIIDILRENIGFGKIDRVPGPTPLIPRKAAAGVRPSLGQRVGGALFGDVGAAAGFRRGFQEWAFSEGYETTRLGRLFQAMPGKGVNVEDFSLGFAQLDEFMTSLHWQRSRRDYYLSRWAQLADGEQDGAFRIVRDVLGELGDDMTDGMSVLRKEDHWQVVLGGTSARTTGGVGTKTKRLKFSTQADAVRYIDERSAIPWAVRREVTRSFKRLDELRSYFNNKAGNPVQFAGGEIPLLIDGSERIMPTAQLLSEYLAVGIPLPDPRTIRRVLSDQTYLWARVIDGKITPRRVTKIMDASMSKVWKPLVLLRAAWPVRVISEEQVRMAASGLDSATSHPLSWVSWMVSDPTKLTDLTGTPYTVLRKWRAAMSHGHNNLLNNGHLRHGWDVGFIHVERTDARFYKYWARDLGRLWGDEVAPMVAKDYDEAVEWFLRGEGKVFRERLARNGNAAKMGLIDDDLARVFSQGKYNTADQFAEAYLDSVRARLHLSTGGDFVVLPDGSFSIIDNGDATLLSAIANGQLEEINLLGINSERGLNKLADKLQSRYGERAPERIKGPADDFMPGLSSSDYDDVINQLFDWAMSVPTNKLSRAPAWGQHYANALVEAMEWADGATQREILTRAETAFSSSPKVQKKVIARLKAVADRTGDRTGPQLRTKPPRNGTTVLRSEGQAADLRANVSDLRDNFWRLSFPTEEDSAGMFDLIDDDVLDDIGRVVRGEIEPGDISVDARNDLVQLVEQFGEPDDLAEALEDYFRWRGNQTRWIDDSYRTGEAERIRGPGGQGPGRQRRGGQGPGGDRPRWLEPPTGPPQGVENWKLHVWSRQRRRWYERARATLDELEATPGAEQDLTEIRQLLDVVANTLDMDVLTTDITDISEIVLRRGLPRLEELYGDVMLRQVRPRFFELSGDDFIEEVADSRRIVERASRRVEAGKRTTFDEVGESLDEAGLDWHGHDLTDDEMEFLFEADAAEARSSYDDLIDSDGALGVDEDPDLLEGRQRAIDDGFNAIRDFDPAEFRAEGASLFEEHHLDRLREALRQDKSVSAKELLAKLDEMEPDELRALHRSFVESQAEKGRLGNLEFDDEVPGAVLKEYPDLLQRRHGTNLMIDNWEIADDLAKSKAMEETRGLLYDLSRRAQISDIARNFIPFAEAWGEILTTWSRLMRENPHVIRRGQQLVEGARGSGFFSTDENGEEIFNYPGGGILANWMFGEDSGVTIELSGRAKSVNLFTSNVLPGVGPVVQMPVAALQSQLPPGWTMLTDLVLPFGGDELNSPGDIIDMVLPPWMEKILVAFGSGDGDFGRLYNNTVMDVYKGLILSGQYDDSTPQGAERALRRAKSEARKLSLIRMMVQFTGPTGFRPRFFTEDKQGMLWLYQTLADDYRERLETPEWAGGFSYDEGKTFDWFTETYGLDPTLFITAKTKVIEPRPVTEEGSRWAAENRGLFDRFSATAYYAHPDEPVAAFDYNAYVGSIREGARVALDPQQWVVRRNDTLGRLQMEKARQQVGDRTDPTAAQFLRDTRVWLMSRYPGYQEANVGLPERLSRESVIAELYRWNTEPRLTESDAGRGLDLYLIAREQAKAESESLGLSPNSFASAERTAHVRNYLRETAEWIINQHPDFGVLWLQIFSRELTDDGQLIAPLSQAPTLSALAVNA